uniref:Family with sequence similarity 169 member B n=1 Tax=Astyanax mexicanus TaxID=7994 RepID=A0A8B9LDJ6_ASTMX
MESSPNLSVTQQGSRYPVDLPCQDYDELKPDSGKYLSDMQTFNLPSGNKVKVTQENIGQLNLFVDDDPPHSLLALHAPADETQVVAIYLHRKWWPIYEVLKTSSKSRCGLLLVESVMERVILFLLSQIIFGILERPLGENMYFSTHPMREYAKILWQDGEAVGFYTIKKKGSLCDGCTGQSYHLPVLDTVYVRSRWRKNGLGLQMLQDFCSSMPKESAIGISYPISASMFGVCKKYLETHQDQRERLYEVEAPGDWSQRRNVWLSIRLQLHPTQSASSDESPHSSQVMERKLIRPESKVFRELEDNSSSSRRLSFRNCWVSLIYRSWGVSV